MKVILFLGAWEIMGNVGNGGFMASLLFHNTSTITFDIEKRTSNEQVTKVKSRGAKM